MTDPVQLWRIHLVAPESTYEALEAVLSDFGSVSAHTGAAEPDSAPGDDRPAEDWRIEAICESEPDISLVTLALANVAGRIGLQLPEVHIEKLPQVDWLAQNRKGFPPVHAGRFFVHATFDDTPPPPGSLALSIDAGPAFGSGHHDTTRGCLLALDRLLNLPARPRTLDVGCGSGILALAVAARRKCPVLAVDNDPWAVRTTRENARANGLGRFVTAGLSHGFSRVPHGLRFDLICANILAKPLMRLAPTVARRLAPGGQVILSGLLDRQEAAVRAAYRAQGLHLAARVLTPSKDWGVWPTLVMRRGL
ncbi:MAG TPA: 50S ribosomal protein L11 methyltransferase [Alphaproteobacteria bacterium]|jgi:ribosomal protein L11 methyltransferase